MAYKLQFKTPPGTKKTGINAPVFNSKFAGLSIFPNSDAGYFNARKLPKLDAPVVVMVKKVTQATGNVVAEESGKFWIELNTPKRKSWVRSDVASWMGKESSKKQQAKGKVNEQATKEDYRADLRQRPIKFLATTRQVNIRSLPGLNGSVVEVATLGTFRKEVGTATGKIKTETASGKTWIELDRGAGKTGWVRSDVVHWKGAKTQGEIVKDETKKVVEPITDGISNFFSNIKNAVLLVGGFLIAKETGLLNKINKGGR